MKTEARTSDHPSQLQFILVGLLALLVVGGIALVARRTAPVADTPTGVPSAALSPAPVKPVGPDGEFSAEYLRNAELDGQPIGLSEARADASKAAIPLRLPDGGVIPEARDLRLALRLEGGGYAFYFGRGLRLKVKLSELAPGEQVRSRLESVGEPGEATYRESDVGGFRAAVKEPTYTETRMYGAVHAPGTVIWEVPAASGEERPTTYVLTGENMPVQYLLKVARSLK